jgi:hypothetical protein
MHLECGGGTRSGWLKIEMEEKMLSHTERRMQARREDGRHQA